MSFSSLRYFIYTKVLPGPVTSMVEALWSFGLYEIWKLQILRSILLCPPMLVFAMSFSRSQFHKKTYQSGSPVKVMMKRSSLGLKALAINSYESYALMSWICSGRVFFLFWLVIS